MNNHLIPVPKRLIDTLFDLFIPDKSAKDGKLRLVIRLKCTEISVRQFAAYLSFIDKAYGRLTPKGIVNYSRTSRYELKLAEVRHGSIEIIITQLLSDPDSLKALIMVGLLLKYMPGIFKSVLSTYRDYEEGRLARARRQQIREQIKKDKKLSELPNKQVNQLCQFLDLIYAIDNRNIPKAHKFSKEAVLKIEFEVQTPQEPLSEQVGIRKLQIKRDIDQD